MHFCEIDGRVLIGALAGIVYAGVIYLLSTRNGWQMHRVACMMSTKASPNSYSFGCDEPYELGTLCGN